MSGDILDLPVRRRIFLYVRANPGSHFREIQRDLDLPIGQLEYHLDKLIKGEILVKEVSPGNARFYVRDRFSKEERKVMSVLRKEVPRDIILYLLENPRSTPTNILETFDFTGPNLSYHLRRMIALEIISFDIKGRERQYYILDEELVKALLIMYKSTIMEKVIDFIS